MATICGEIECSDCGCVTGNYDKLECGKHVICNATCSPQRFSFASIEQTKREILWCKKCKEVSPSQGIFIFVDDSNIWIEAKKLQGKQKGYKTSEDHRVRIDVGALTDVIACGRPVKKGKLYGSEPPPVDTVWKKIKERGWEVEKDKRHLITGKEKKVDTRLVAEVTALAVRTPPEERTTIVLVTGDADVIPAIEEVMRESHWKVEVYMWKQAMSHELPRYAANHPGLVEIKHLDDYLSQVSFTNMKFDIKNPRIKHLAHTYGVVFTMEDDSFKRRVPTKSWINQLESIAQWPCQFYWFTEENHKSVRGKDSNDLVVVFKRDGKSEFNLPQFLSNIQCDAHDNAEGEKYKLPHTLKVQPFQQFWNLNFPPEKSKDIEMFDAALEQVGILTNEEVLEGSDNETVFECDMPDDWTTYRRKPRGHHRLRQRYSDPCPFKFNCKFGTRCQNQHSDKEKCYFKGRTEARGVPVRKVNPCKYFDDRTLRCTKSKTDCDFAHGADDAWCLNCISSGHFTQDCSKPPKAT